MWHVLHIMSTVLGVGSAGGTSSSTCTCPSCAEVRVCCCVHVQSVAILSTMLHDLLLLLWCASSMKLCSGGVALTFGMTTSGVGSTVVSARLDRATAWHSILDGALSSATASRACCSALFSQVALHEISLISFGLFCSAANVALNSATISDHRAWTSSAIRARRRSSVNCLAARSSSDLDNCTAVVVSCVGVHGFGLTWKNFLST